MPLFSVIIPTFNRANMTREAVLSVLQQTCDDYEIIVVDDGSSDNTEEALSDLSENIQYYYQENSGVASARNTGLSNSSGQYLCYLDSDDLWPEDKLYLYKKCIEVHSAPAFIFSDFHKHDMTLPKPYEVSNSDMFSYIHDLTTPLSSDTFLIKNDSLFQLLFRGYPMYPSTFAIRRDVHDHFRWDPGIRKSEDFNLVLRLATRYPLTYINKSLTTVRVHDSNKSADYVTKNHVHLNSMKLYRDLYAPKEALSICNYYISQKQFAVGAYSGPR